jgi:hypothetical protein
MTGGFCGAITVDQYHASVPRRGSHHQGARNLIVVCKYRPGQAAFAQFCKLDGFIQVFIRQYRADRPERLHAMHRLAGQWFVAVEQYRGKK